MGISQCQRFLTPTLVASRRKKSLTHSFTLTCPSERLEAPLGTSGEVSPHGTARFAHWPAPQRSGRSLLCFLAPVPAAPDIGCRRAWPCSLDGCSRRGSVRNRSSRHA